MCRLVRGDFAFPCSVYPRACVQMDAISQRLGDGWTLFRHGWGQLDSISQRLMDIWTLSRNGWWADGGYLSTVGGKMDAISQRLGDVHRAVEAA